MPFWWRGNDPARYRPSRHIWLRVVLILAIVVLLIQAVPTPWAVHIGGRFTPLGQWQGYGRVRASNGGRYLLYAQLEGGLFNGGPARCASDECSTLTGSAKLCAENGRTYAFRLDGAVHGWLTTDGSLTSIDLSGSQPVPLPAGQVVALRGRWHGPALALASPDSSFTEVFTPRGAIRTATSAADAGTASVTLRFGSAGQFAAACRALAAAS
ncbi:MAG TPA: hypothetical protein VH637_16785 [Streptosporangiaceae bacterium]|jgi:hypothetical protein